MVQAFDASLEPSYGNPIGDFDNNQGDLTRCDELEDSSTISQYFGFEDAVTYYWIANGITVDHIVFRYVF